VQYVEGGDAMTRQEMSDYLADLVIGDSLTAREAERVDEIAVELRKSCAGCKHFRQNTQIMALRTGPFPIEHSECAYWSDEGASLDDGSGHCHEWSAK
jgi:hypothetical protein